MSYRDAKWKRLGAKEGGVFSGGYIDNTQNLYLPDNSSPYLRNARLDGNSIIIRPGHQLHGTLTSGDYPRGIGSYLRADPSNDVMVVRHNQDTNKDLITIDTDGNITEISTSTDITSDNRMFFQNIGDVIYCMNGSDDFGKLDGTTYTTPSTGIMNFAPSFSVVFNGSHWASGWSSNPNKVYKSVADDYEDFNSTGSDSFTFEETITGLESTNEAIFYFTKNSISATGVSDIQDIGGSISYSTRKIQAKEGALNNPTIISRGPDLFFVTPSLKIQRLRRGYNIDGFEVEELSHRKYGGIEEIIKTLDSDQSDAFGYYVADKNIIKWFFKADGSTFNDICIVYDLTKDAFLIDGQKFFYDGIHFKGKNYTLSMIEEKVYRDEYSQDDEETAIPFEYRTKEFYLSDPTYKKLLWESRTLVDINELASLTQAIYADGGQVDTKTINSSNISVSTGGIGVGEIGETPIGTGTGEEEEELQEVTILRTKGNLNVIGKKFQWRFTCTDLAAKVRLKDIQALMETKPALASNLTT